MYPFFLISLLLPTTCPAAPPSSHTCECLWGGIHRAGWMRPSHSVCSWALSHVHVPQFSYRCLGGTGLNKEGNGGHVTASFCPGSCQDGLSSFAFSSVVALFQTCRVPLQFQWMLRCPWPALSVRHLCFQLLTPDHAAAPLLTDIHSATPSPAFHPS